MNGAQQTIGAVVLAAGGSSRLGQPKQLVRIAGHTLVFRAAYAAVAAGCSPVVVVVGAVVEDVVREIESLGDAGVRAVTCAGWRDGLSASLEAGIRALAADVAAVVVLPCDQPALEPGVIRQLIDAWDGTSAGCVACGYAGTVGAPALFGSAFFPRILELSGDRGAKQLLDGARIVAWPEGARDVDSPRDL